jgi:hypothetical protein
MVTDAGQSGLRRGALGAAASESPAEGPFIPNSRMLLIGADRMAIHGDDLWHDC